MILELCEYEQVRDLLPLIPNTEYLIAKDGDIVLGAYMLTKKNGEIEIHQNIKQIALRWHKSLASLCLDYVLESNHRVVTYIPDYHRSMVNFLLKLGFVYEGKKREVCIKDGQLYDCHMLALLKNEWVNYGIR